ncbi:MAG TPA: hypothetical protein VHV52_03585 [Gaiellaceae bacterium]|jgi:hypothetical protein|nr:hypothetical protein [Gaiellaceae bacterium]
MIAIVLGLVLAAGVVVLVALPFLREPVVADDRLDAPSEAETRRLTLVEERDRALAALKELEFDHRSGKVDDADYRALIGPLRQAAAAALRSLDAERGYGAGMSDLPAEPAPPPDEGTPPTPAPVPEPYPPPDEATIPSASE